MRVLYISNIEVPYRSAFFDELARECDLTVLYERRASANRDRTWTGSHQGSCKKHYLHGIPVRGENSFSLGILPWLFRGYDAVIVGCFNSPVQAMAILVMRLFGIPYYLNTDGEVFLSGKGLKTRLKRFFLSGAKGYLAAGEKAAANLEKELHCWVYAYRFSSLTEEELKRNRTARSEERKDTVLVVGQNYDYKGVDIALQVAEANPRVPFHFVGMGKRTELFIRRQDPQRLPNVQITPFLQKEALMQAYQSCAALLLPSRQECWGLVINEAASFGTPIVSTWGSGAAVEFLADAYPQLLARPGDAADLGEKLGSLLAMTRQQKEEYSAFLLCKSAGYSIEENVRIHMRALTSGAGILDDRAAESGSEGDNMERKLVSVVVPVYQVEPYLDRCVESIVNQTYRNLEILLIDDGSPDACPAMCDAWAARDPRIRVIHKENQGLGMARNTGIDHAAGAYICFVDSDDHIAPDTVEKAYAQVEAQAAELVLYGFWTGSTCGQEKSLPLVYTDAAVTRELLPEILSHENRCCIPANVLLSACTCLISMELIRRSGWRLVSEREIISEDVYSLLELFGFVCSAVVLPEGLYYYCENQTSLTHTYRPDRYTKVRQFYQQCCALCLRAGYIPAVAERCAGPFLSFTIGALKQEAVHTQAQTSARHRVRKILDDPVLRQVLAKTDYRGKTCSQKVLFWAMKHRLSGLCCILIGLRGRFPRRG